jgi:hypothetical protein
MSSRRRAGNHNYLVRARVLAAFRAAALRPAGPLVRTAFLAAADRLLALRFRAAERAWPASALCDAAWWPSRLSALRTARERFAEGFAFR